MKREWIWRFGFCLTLVSYCLYSYVEKQNEVTQLKIRIPEVERETLAIRQEIQRLQVEINQRESPAHLLDIAHRPEYRHLKHPLMREVFSIPQEGIAAE